MLSSTSTGNPRCKPPLQPLTLNAADTSRGKYPKSKSTSSLRECVGVCLLSRHTSNTKVTKQNSPIVTFINTETSTTVCYRHIYQYGDYHSMLLRGYHRSSVTESSYKQNIATKNYGNLMGDFSGKKLNLQTATPSGGVFPWIVMPRAGAVKSVKIRLSRSKPVSVLSIASSRATVNN